MTKFVALDDPSAVDACEIALRGGDAIVVPTDTVYGLAALPSSTERLYALKGRPESVPIAVLVESLDQAAELVDVTVVAGRLARAFWPGPLTIVMRRLDGLDGGATLGARAPDHVFAHALTRCVGPLATTSANRHGASTPSTAAEVAEVFDDHVALVVDGGVCAGVASTVVDVTRPDLVILRAGPITEEQIRRAALR